MMMLGEENGHHHPHHHPHHAMHHHPHHAGLHMHSSAHLQRDLIQAKMMEDNRNNMALALQVKNEPIPAHAHPAAHYMCSPLDCSIPQL